MACILIQLPSQPQARGRGWRSPLSHLQPPLGFPLALVLASDLAGSHRNKYIHYTLGGSRAPFCSYTQDPRDTSGILPEPFRSAARHHPVRVSQPRTLGG
jgi:hypothetical protein